MIQFRVRVSGPLFERGAAERVDREMQATIARIAARGHKLVVEGTPAGISSAGGGLRGSITTAYRGTPAKREAVVASNLFYAPIVERGRAPGRMPPSSGLQLWVRRILGVPPGRVASVAFLVARKIGRDGTRGKRMFEQAAQRLQPYADQESRSLGERLARMLNGR